MKWKFTYRELTLILGILVAMVIMITIWMWPSSLDSGDVSEKPEYGVSKPATKIIIGKTVVLIKELLK